jgi:hypothetical protein
MTGTPLSADETVKEIMGQRIRMVQALVTGTVYAKSGIWGAWFRRSDSAFRYWSAIVCYGLLSLALLFVF